MKRFLPIFSCLVAFVLSAGADDRPNFILFITDDISAEDLGCYGDSVARTRSVMFSVSCGQWRPARTAAVPTTPRNNRTPPTA